MFLTKKKEKWTIQRNKTLRGVLVGGDISKNAAADYYYRKAMQSEMVKFIEACYKDLSEVYAVIQVENATAKRKPSPASVRFILNKYKGAKLEIFLKNSEKIIKKWLKMASKSTDKNIKKILSEMAGKNIAIEYDKTYDEALKLMVQRNVQLIRNTSTQTLTNIENIVFDSMTTGEGWYGIEQTLKSQKHIAEDRISRIARDQTAKTNQALNELAQREAGIKYFMWRTAQDERVRDTHRELNGKIYKWNDEYERLPVISIKQGTKIHGYPAQAVNCRCIARPVWILNGYKAVWKESTKSYEVVHDRHN